ncbi:hypothetical protein CDD83_8591 [Cordyceps sp. RAO-2017]|nr:hypothetical protein CDD83_8591 [Cordyceps sp. RAO-2017]
MRRAGHTAQRPTPLRQAEIATDFPQPAAHGWPAYPVPREYKHTYSCNTSSLPTWPLHQQQLRVLYMRTTLGLSRSRVTVGGGPGPGWHLFREGTKARRNKTPPELPVVLPQRRLRAGKSPNDDRSQQVGNRSTPYFSYATTSPFVLPEEAASGLTTSSG